MAEKLTKKDLFLIAFAVLGIVICSLLYLSPPSGHEPPNLFIAIGFILIVVVYWFARGRKQDRISGEKFSLKKILLTLMLLAPLGIATYILYFGIIIFFSLLFSRNAVSWILIVLIPFGFALFAALAYSLAYLLKTVKKRGN